MENIEVLARYGSEDAVVQLDRLGGQAWQARRAQVKERIKHFLKTHLPDFQPPSELDGFVAGLHAAKTEIYTKTVAKWFPTSLFTEDNEVRNKVEATVRPESAGVSY